MQRKLVQSLRYTTDVYHREITRARELRLGKDANVWKVRKSQHRSR